MKTLLLALLALPSAAAAGAVRAELVSSRAAVIPGETFTAGLRLVHKPGWHTYWQNPGDSGMGTTLAWRLPPGWAAAPFLWPTPARIVAEPLTSFGYGGDLVLPLELTAPATKGRAVLRATADWLECAEICVPGKAELSLPVDVADAPADGPHAGRVRDALAALPRNGNALDARREEGKVVLVIDGRHPGAEFFPWEPLFEGGRGPVTVGPGRTELTLALSPGAQAPARLSGILVRPGQPALTVALPVGSGGAAARYLLLAFLGGLLLNLMPCVFPVLSLKVLGLLERAGGSPAQARAHAAAYAAGVVVSFELLALGLLAARAAGAALGWGFHLQSAPVVAALAVLCVLVGLNLLGLFEVGTRLMGAGGRASGGSFLSGVFAVVVAAPCTAPFMGAALGWALTRPVPETLAVFAALGLGTAAPFALLASWPGLLKRLPRPGAWMETLKKILSVPMFLTAAWLLWVLARLMTPSVSTDGWKVWSPEAVSASRAKHTTVFVDFTASWCLTCQVNERVVLSRPEVKAALARGDAYKADWTNRDAVIAAELARHGRNGVPLYIVYPKGGEPVLLPELLTPKLVIDALGEP